MLPRHAAGNYAGLQSDRDLLDGFGRIVGAPCRLLDDVTSIDHRAPLNRPLVVPECSGIGLEFEEALPDEFLDGRQAFSGNFGVEPPG
ncbi:MAG: hypothetical protein AAB316_16370, partial [Bacteroidota bacterium]